LSGISTKYDAGFEFSNDDGKEVHLAKRTAPLAVADNPTNAAAAAAAAGR